MLAGQLDKQPEEQRWLIDGLWARSAIGLIGGAPKSCKTWMGLDMAISVATGTAALDHFAVSAKGPALIYLAADALPQVRCRIESICRRRQLKIDQLDLHVITAPTLRLDQKADQDRLAETISVLRPSLVLLDPLVRLHRLDENSAGEISGLLGFFRELQRRFHTAIVLVHHASKKQRSQPGQALRGSSDLHAIGDCNAYLARKNQHIMLTVEHRAARSPEPMLLDLVSDNDESAVALQVCNDHRQHADQSDVSIADRILDAMDRVPTTRSALRETLRVNNQKLGDALTKLEEQQLIVRSEGGWHLPT